MLNKAKTSSYTIQLPAYLQHSMSTTQNGPQSCSLILLQLFKLLQLLQLLQIFMSTTQTWPQSCSLILLQLLQLLQV